MIDVVISDNCPLCHDQLDIMNRSFFTDEYRVINILSAEFQDLDCKDSVEGVPFLVVRNEDGRPKYAKVGVHDGTLLRKIERRSPFNLHRHRALAE